ncbi:hypothetical protein D3C86_1143930 [compost metagenome]
MADLGRIQPDADEVMQIGLGGLQRGEGFVFGQVAQEAKDQAAGDAQFGLGPVHARNQALDHHAEGHAPVGVGLGIEEDLGVAHVVGGGALEIGEGQILEILARQQHGCARVIDVEEVLKVGEVIGRAHGLDAVIGDGDAVALRQLEHQFGLKRALDVQVQFGLGQAGDEGVEGHEGRLLGVASPLITLKRAYIRSGVSMPSRSSAVSSWCRLAAARARREPLVAASGATRIGQAA